MQIVILCNPENRRAEMFCSAAKKLRLPSPRVVGYNDILEGNVCLSEFLTPATLFRIESPGENFETERRLIARGAEIVDCGGSQRISCVEALRLKPDHGRIRFLRQWFLGFNDLLFSIENDILVSGCRVLNTPQAIRLMFDKIRCQQHLHDHGIPVPHRIPQATSYDALRHCLELRLYKRVFIKPAHASSASGVMAYRIQGSKEELYTSVELVVEGNEIRLYNSLKLKRYADKGSIRAILDFILNEGAVVEEWIPKACIEQKFFDVRIVVINGRARAVLPRLSGGPITNLHLGNERGDPQQVKELIGDKGFNELLLCAEKAVSSIDGAYYAGADVLITAGSQNPRVLELNAFGDLLPGVTTGNGDDIYTSVLKELLYAA